MIQKNKIDNNYARNDFYSLTKVLGQGTKSGFGLSNNSKNGLMSYITGPYVILYDMKSDKEVSFLKNTNNKIISCLDFSSDGTKLATGEGNCKNGEISIYKIYYDNTTNEEAHSLLTSFKNHKFGIDKVKFFCNDDFLISIGNKDDKSINIFDIVKKEIIFSTKYNRAILGFDINDKFMVMTGDKFVKIYNFEKIVSKNENNLRNGMAKSVVDLAKLRDRVFIAAAIYLKNDTNPKDKTFFLTLDCFLAEMEVGTNLINRWVFLKTEKGLSLNIFGKNIACGCSDGILRLFNADNLTHIMTFHKPLPIGHINISYECRSIPSFPKESSTYPDITILKYNYYYQKLVVTYSNGTTLIWDYPLNFDKNERNNSIGMYRAFSFHTGSITSIDYMADKDNDVINLATCSDDGTVICWGLSIKELINLNGGFEMNLNAVEIPSEVYSKPDHIQYSKYIQHVFFLNSIDLTPPFKVNKNFIFNNAPLEDPLFSLTSIKFTPDKIHIIVSDNQGNIYVLSLLNYQLITKIEAQNESINSIDTVYDGIRNKTYLASGCDDCSLCIIDISEVILKTKEYECKFNENEILLEELESPIISVQFTIDKYKELKVVVSESDSSITFFKIMYTPTYSLQTIQKYKENNLKTYCLSSASTLHKILSGHNGQIRIWKNSSCIIHKHFQVCKGDKPLDNFRVVSDNTGRMFATSNNDKIIRIRATHNGNLLTKIPIAESISALFFCLNDNYLVAASVEGYIYFYRINMEYVEKLAHNNDLINSKEENEKIQRKLKFLQQWIKYDNNLSKVEHVRHLIEKNQNSEELTFDDLKILDSYYKEEKSKFQKKEEKLEQKEKKVEPLQLKEEQPNNNDDIENENNRNEGNDNKNNMSRSKIFEFGLKDKTSYDSAYGRKSTNIGRVSLTDTYKFKMNSKNKFMQKEHNEEDNKNCELSNEDINVKFNKNLEQKENLSKIPNSSFNKKSLQSNEEINELQKIISNTKDVVNKIENVIKDEKIKKNNSANKICDFSNILQNSQDDKKEECPFDSNIKLSNVQIESEFKDDCNNNLLHESVIPEEIAEESKLDPSTVISKKDFNLIDNSQKFINQSYIRNMIITQSNFELHSTSNILSQIRNSLPVRTRINSEIDFVIPAYKQKVDIKDYKICNEINFAFSGKNTSTCKKLIEIINKLDIDDFNDTELSLIESNLSELLDQIRIKRGQDPGDIVLERMISKYSALLIKKVGDNFNK